MEKEVLNLILVEIREMKGDMSELKSDMKEVKERVTNVEARISNVESDMIEVKERLTNVEEYLSYVKKDLAEFNKETSERIRNVVTSHYMEFKKYVKSNNSQHNLYNAKLLQFNKEN